MAADRGSLRALENLMNEFFAGPTTNERKRQIESILGTFSQQQDAWKQCLYYMSETQNSYVAMYCLTTLENIINKKWDGLMADERTEIRSTLYRYLLAYHKATPYFIRNKLVKLVVDIARLSWPHFYPDFFTNVLSLSRNPETVHLCIIFLQTISEELVTPKEELLSTRRNELHRLLSQQVPTILSLLSSLLDGVIEKQKNAVTATPPPSPTHGNHSPSPSLSSSSPSPIQSGLISIMFHNLENGCSSRTLLQQPLDPESEVIAALTLRCLTHLFSWIPLSSLITPQLVNTIFLFASLGADPLHNKLSNGANSSHLDNHNIESLGVYAMSAINEIMSKNCVPQDFEDFLLQMFQNTFHLLQRMTHDNKCAVHLQSLPSNYIDKFSEFLRLLVSNHLRRFENNSQFPILDFLGLLFRYTFHQPNMDAYFNCLEVWSIFLDYLTTKCVSESDEQPAISRYEDALNTLAQAILHKIQLRHNQGELEDLDHDLLYEMESGSLDLSELHEEDLSEWSCFFSQNMEIISKIADLMPDQVFTLVYEPFKEAAKIYLSLQLSYTETEPRVRQLDVSTEQECSHLHIILRDLSSLLQALGRLFILFLGKMLPKRSQIALQVVEKLVEMCFFSSGQKLYEVKTATEYLHSDLIEVHAQLLATLRTWVHWLSQLYGQQFVQVFPGGTQTHQHQDTCHAVNKQMLVAATTILQPDVPAILVNCGVQLLLSLSLLVRSPVALELDQVQSLYTRGGFIVVDTKVRRKLYRALVNFLLLPWPSFIVDHKMDLRKQHLSTFINSFTRELLQLNIPSLAENKNHKIACSKMIILTLSAIRSQIDELSTADKTSREIYYQCVQDVIQRASLLFPIYVQQSNVCEEIVSLMEVTMQVLRVQLGPSKVEMTIQTFLDVFSTQQHLQLAVTTQDSDAIKVVEKFLKLLELIVSEPGQSFKRFIPNTISLCMDHIYTSVRESSSPEVKGPLFDLIRSLLHHNWNYFFKSSLKISPSTTNHDAVENEAQFIQIMHAFGHSFMQADISIFKQNLETLESLNSKYKLYQKSIVRTTMLAEFITVLLQVLVNRSQDLLQEEITITIYNMAAVDFTSFFSSFIPMFLVNIEGLHDQQKSNLKDNLKTDIDLPSFTQNIQRFVNDLRFFRTCNASLPAGSIKL